MTINKKIISVIILVVSLILGLFFRFNHLGTSPKGFYLDEAAMGYDAYSVLKTGKDEYGKEFPIIFRSFGDFKTPIYTYMIIPLIPLFDLSVLAVRLPSAIFGFLSIPLLYFLIKKITPEKYSSLLASISALFLSISPWHIIFSRTAYETNIALFFLLLGTLMFINALKKPWLFVLSSLSFAVSFTAYHAERLVVPILVLALAIYYWKKITSEIKIFVIPVLISFVIGVAIIFPTVMLMRTPGFLSRTTTLNIFSYVRQMPWGYKESTTNIGQILNTPQVLTAKEFASLYISYFSPRYLFSIGDSGPRSSYPDLGTFFVWQFPLYLFGIYYFLKEKGISELKLFLITLLLISPIPAALTRDPYTTIRSLPQVIPLIIIMSFGLIKILEIKSSLFNKLKYYLFAVLIIYSSTKMALSIFYFNDYFRSQHWDYGWKSIVDKIPELDPNLPIVVDNSRGEPYIHLLFFTKFDPSQYQKDNFEVPLSEYYTNMDRNLTKHIGRITVKNIEWGIDTTQKEQYLIADDMVISDQQIEDHHMTKIDTINYPNGIPAYKIIKTNPR